MKGAVAARTQVIDMAAWVLSGVHPGPPLAPAAYRRAT